MSRKGSEKHLLVPGEEAWEVWRCPAGASCERITVTTTRRADEIQPLPGGDLVMLFPVRDFQVMPLQVPTTDEDLFEEAAVMHAERLGVRPDPLAGTLSDTQVVAKSEEATALLHMVLRSPGEGDLPRRTPRAFDLSARAFPVEGDAVSVWRELGRWVYAIHSDGALLYCGASAAGEQAPGPALLREVKLALGQLSLQGLGVKPDRVWVWTESEEPDATGALMNGLGVMARAARRPDPVLPKPASRLLPEDVRAARQASQRKAQIAIGLGLVALAYLGLAGWFGFGIWQAWSEQKRLAREADAVRGVSEEFQAHQSRWEELGPVVDETLSPLEVMLHVANTIPRGQGLRLATAEIDLKEVKLTGSAPQSAPINAYSLALKNHPDLRSYQWETGVPNNTAKGWEFRFQASLPTGP